MKYELIIDFWFEEIDSGLWWKKDEQFDQLLSDRFGEIHRAGSRGELFDWRETAIGRLAEVIVLDQFSRNIHRDTPQAFACDAMALVLSQEAISLGADLELEQRQRLFMYMPFMHSESRLIHEVAVELFTRLGRPGNLEFELKHKAIIDRFGRYPHRNEILNRESTTEEIEFLKEPGSNF
jgi:uncharacterized protein (DUF924 family)